MVGAHLSNVAVVLSACISGLTRALEPKTYRKVSCVGVHFTGIQPGADSSSPEHYPGSSYSTPDLPVIVMLLFPMGAGGGVYLWEHIFQM